MFRKRSGQKPDEVFIRDFQHQFGHVATTPFNLDTGVKPDDIVSPNTNVQGLPAFDFNPVQFPTNATFVSSPLSRQNCSCTLFKSRMCAVLHSPAGDLHTPMHECDSIPTSTLPWGRISDGQQSRHTSLLANDAYQLEYFPRPVFPWRNSNPFYQQPNHSPRSFQLHDPNLEIGPLESLPEAAFARSKSWAPKSHSSPFRYQVTLHAPTATYNKECEIPVTYLNRRQAYRMSVIDTVPPITASPLVRYRTHIRISFDDEKQRADPAAAWKLWMEGRGLTEARETNGKLAAVEFVAVKPNAAGPVETPLELQSSLLDGFCVSWAGNPQAGRFGCDFHVVFNFLSTDFSLSKGVKGASLRLCAKTEMVSSDFFFQNHQHVTISEISCCKVKLFRDHGSERKIANDIAQLKKAIERVEESIAHAGTNGSRSSGKRRRGKLPLVARGSESTVQQLAPTDHHNAQDPRGTDTLAVDEDPHRVLFVLKTMLSSSQPSSLLSLPGDEGDDPDRFPVVLPNPLLGPLQADGSITSASVPSRLSTDARIPEAAEQEPFPPGVVHTHAAASRSVNSINQNADNANFISRPLTSMSIPMRSRVGNHQRAVACFYVIRRTNGQNEPYHHALYLLQRTLSEFIKQLARIHDVLPESIIRVVRVNSAGLRILVDDNVVQETPEGQDMMAEFLQAENSPAIAPTWQVNLFY